MRSPGRPKPPPDLFRSPGIAHVRFEGVLEDARSARRPFDKLARSLVTSAEVDLFDTVGFSSSGWAAIAWGVRKLVRTGCRVTIYADTSLRHLLALTVLPRPVRVIWSSLRRAA
jgi:hypothetical protein